MRPTTPFAAALLAAAALPAVAYGADGDLRAAILAPAAAPPGRLVRLEARLVRERAHLREEISPTAEEAPPFAWRLVAPPAGYEIADWTFDGGRTVVFATSEPGAYRFVLAAAVSGEAGGPPTPLLVEHTLVIGSVPPKPVIPDPPSPPLPPTPGPALPDGRFDLAQVAHDLAVAEVPAADRGLAPRLAENYRAVAARVAAGTLSAPDEILAATAEGNRAALGVGTEAWRPFFTALAARMKALGVVGRLAEPGDYAAAWGEIAAGLDAAR